MRRMKEIMMASAMLITAPIMLSTSAMAQEFPLVAGDYTSMSGIYIEDGGTLAYAKYLAGEWAKNQEYAKSRGWISDYKVYVNVDARDGEPHIYLTQTYRSVPSGAELEQRDKEMAAWSKKTDAQLDAESGDRAKFRKQRGTMMLQEYIVRK